MPTLRAFHASLVPSIVEFFPLAHFGTEKAAHHRAVSKSMDQAFLYEVDLHFRRSLEVPDLSSHTKSAQHHWMRLVDQLHYELRPKTITAQERNEVFSIGRGNPAFDREAAACLAKILVGKGIDALSYPNGFEDPGSISWIVMDPTKIKILDVSELAQPATRRTPRP